VKSGLRGLLPTQESLNIFPFWKNGGDILKITKTGADIREQFFIARSEHSGKQQIQTYVKVKREGDSE